MVYAVTKKSVKEELKVNISMLTCFIFCLFSREPSVNPNLSICQPTLGESFTCVNRSQNVYVGGVEEVCGPCKAGLVCKTVG